MKFTSFREFRESLTTIDDVVAYLRTDLTSILRDLKKGLTRIDFNDNFSSFTKEVVDLPAGDTIKIRNQLREGKSFLVPSSYIIVRRKEGAESIVDIDEGDEKWTAESVFLKNTGASSATFTVLFLR